MQNPCQSSHLTLHRETTIVCAWRKQMVDNRAAGPVRTVNQPGNQPGNPSPQRAPASTGWQPVSSSHLSAVQYDYLNREMRIQFHGGSIYAYDGVPQDVYDALMGASSKGKYFHAAIEGAYAYRRVA